LCYDRPALLEITDFGAQAADTTELEAKALGSCIPRYLLGDTELDPFKGHFFEDQAIHIYQQTWNILCIEKISGKPP